MKSIYLKIRRQKDPKGSSYWEEFQVPFYPGMTVISALKDIQKKPVNARGEAVSPVVWDCNCLEEACGSCAMLINGRPTLACSAFVEKIAQPIVLEPLTKFIVLRDLVCDRAQTFDDNKKIRPWRSFDGTQVLRHGPSISKKISLLANVLSQCIACGVCMEVCPQYNERSSYLGAYSVNQARLLNLHPIDEVNKEKRIHRMMEEGGIEDCENAQSCEKACPKGIPLVESIGKMKREVTVQALWQFLG